LSGTVPRWQRRFRWRDSQRFVNFAAVTNRISGATMDQNASITWFSDEAAPLPLPAGGGPFGKARVSEYVLGRNYIPLRTTKNGAQAKLFNTDPVNWDSFMFAFDQAKQKERLDSVDLLHEPDALSRVALRAGLKIDGADSPLPTQFEIKISKSTGLLTFYIFTYEIVDFDRDFGDMKFAVVDIGADRTYALPEKVASNVRPVIDRIARSLT